MDDEVPFEDFVQQLAVKIFGKRISTLRLKESKGVVSWSIRGPLPEGTNKSKRIKSGESGE